MEPCVPPIRGGALDVVQQRVDRGAAARVIRARPPFGSQASTRLLFGAVPEIAHRLITLGRSRAFGDGVPGCQYPGHPHIVALSAAAADRAMSATRTRSDRAAAGCGLPFHGRSRWPRPYRRAGPPGSRGCRGLPARDDRLQERPDGHHSAPTPTRLPKKRAGSHRFPARSVIPSGVPSTLRARAARGGTRERYWTISVPTMSG